MNKYRRFFVMMTLTVLALQFFGARMSVAVAESPGAVVINEVAWGGNADSSSDEWIELYNTTSQSIDLSGWYIEDDGTSVYTISSGQIAPHGYFLIEDNEDAVANLTADSVIPISLANAGDSLVLKDASDVAIDTVNGSGLAWYAGDSVDRASMERIDPGVTLDSADNWASATSSNGATGRAGSEILGTPGGANSNYGGSGPSVFLNPMETQASQDESVTISVEVDSVTDLYSYGVDVSYDPGVLTFVSASEGSFLNADSTATAFNASLEGGTEGTVVVGNARLLNPPSGIDGSGKLFDLTFDVDSAASGSSAITFGAESFLADSSADILTQFNDGSVNVSSGAGLSVSNLVIDLGTEDYSLELTWSGTGATSYLVNRQEADGSFVQLAEVTDTFFVDDLNLVPNATYNYQVIAVNGSNQSAPAEMSGADDRGVTGDNDRSGRVDGRDLERLARAYGSELGDEEYDGLVDTNYDGVIDGSDLIDIGVNFGLTY